jgi:predicted ATP-dependent protease
VPSDVREKIEMVPVETMDEVFTIALHRVIVPQRVSGNFIIEVEDDEEEEGDASQEPAQRVARPGRPARPR